MKTKSITLLFLACASLGFAQQKKSLWELVASKNVPAMNKNSELPSEYLYKLDVAALEEVLSKAPLRTSDALGKSSSIISLPDADGNLEKYTVYENPQMEPALAEKYPEIKSYMAVGIDNPDSAVYFSISPLGFKSMALHADKSAVFIEPYTQDLAFYSAYKKSDRKQSLSRFECKIAGQAETAVQDNLALRPNADDGKLRTFRLALSVTGEYTAYFGGTKANALAAINNTMTRVNGIFGKDLGIKMVLIANNDAIIYTNAATDPYSPGNTGSAGAWNSELQNTLNSVIGSGAYDVGHLFGATGGGGNAGCIGCVCAAGKGSAFTSPGNGNPSGDYFDVDYVAHEFGHQFGGNHTFTYTNEGTGAQMEPGSGSTIMSYAGITGTVNDIQSSASPYFHAISIQQITNNVKAKTCPAVTATGNAVPTANAGLDYTIPKGTPFVLTGSATDANGDALTYCWEQMNVGEPSSTLPSPTRTTGPAFRSFPPSTSSKRYFPQLETVLAGATSTKWEAVPAVARTMNFRMTVRDNKAAGSSNNSDDMVVTVSGAAGPFSVTSPNTAVSYAGGSSQTVTWNVAGTTAN
ncbi:MAG TPA: zinc-dependent metalloprotease family protein, partial [Flavobacterium sp.]|nr:zinc-dependent metalloprotease family protein [Flavobacterium sp.]